MKNPLEVLKQKQAELAELKMQVYALQAVIPLLHEEGDPKPEEEPKNRWP